MISGCADAGAERVKGRVTAQALHDRLESQRGAGSDSARARASSPAPCRAGSGCPQPARARAAPRPQGGGGQGLQERMQGGKDGFADGKHFLNVTKLESR